MKLATHQLWNVFGQDLARDLALPGGSRWEVSTTCSPILTKESAYYVAGTWWMRRLLLERSRPPACGLDEHW